MGCPPLFVVLTAWACTVLVLLAGAFAANPVWHDWLHHGAVVTVKAHAHSDTDSSDSSEESGCAVCAFIHHQCESGAVFAALVLPPGDSQWWVSIPDVVTGSIRKDLLPAERGPPKSA